MVSSSSDTVNTLSAGDQGVPVVQVQRCVPQCRFRFILGASRSTFAVMVDEDR